MNVDVLQKRETSNTQLETWNTYRITQIRMQQSRTKHIIKTKTPLRINVILYMVTGAMNNPKGPYGPSWGPSPKPQAPRWPFAQLATHPKHSGALSPANPNSPLPKVTREARPAAPYTKSAWEPLGPLLGPRTNSLRTVRLNIWHLLGSRFGGLTGPPPIGGTNSRA